MFSIGDKVAHPMHGAGTITGVSAQKIDGEMVDYFEIEMIAGRMTVLVPCVSDKHTLRAVVTNDTLEALLRDLSVEYIDVITNWNQRYRENMVKIKSGDLFKVAEVIKSLKVREKERGLSTGERKVLASAKQILISEVSLVKGISYDEAENTIGQIVIQ